MQVVVLNDGETYTAMSGCRIIDVPQEVLDSEDYNDVDIYIEEAYADGEGVDIEKLANK
jgi:hypothetical protein